MQTETEQMQRKLTLTWILLALVFVMFVWPTLKAWIGFGISGDPRTITPRGDLADFETTTTDLFAAAAPSVVYLTTRSRVSNPFYSRAVEVERGSGSGFIWDETGHIVTNYHVLEGASSAQVVLADQSSYEASLVGASADHDLAVLRIAAPVAKLRPVPIGESHTLLVGQSVFAIGNPFGLSQSLATGVVSAKSRTIEGPSGRSIDDVIQTDAAINPGNSGGPLLDSAGRLIGVNTAIYSPSGASAGVGFSIPVDTVNRVVPQLIANGVYTPPQMGIRVNKELSEIVTSRLGISGVLLLDVVEGGSANQAGLQGTIVRRTELVRLGDIIQDVGGYEVTNTNDLFDALEHFSVGDRVTVQFHRDGESRTTEAELR